jgi:NAD(P)-dependent dehydrogenase (short-subunit alcohol dehydrogenase family)
MARFTGKSIIVTGAGSGIGRASATLFAAEGGSVIAADKTEAVHDTVEAILKAGGTAKAIQMDAGDEGDVERTVALAVAEHGGLDIIYANTEVLRVNLIGPFLAIKHGAPEIIKRGKGAIVCTASVAGIRSGAGGPAYSASKAGVINLVTTAAQQLTGTNVRVNAICPGLIETGMTARVFEYARANDKMDKVGRLNPLKRAGVPEEIARVALFLASDDASYVNGQAWAVDGGLSSSHPVTRQEFGKPAV